MGRELPEAAGPDSLNLLPALLGQAGDGREYLLAHAGTVALREGPWKFIPAGAGIRDGLGPWTRVKAGPQGWLVRTNDDN